jgi:hypothetical protein
MTKHFLADGISLKDRTISSANIDLLSPYISEDDRSPVFFIGAGASMAGNTGMPSTSSLLFQLLFQALSHSRRFTSELNEFSSILKEVGWRIGFEITLNDFWQICENATTQLYQAFGDLEKNCVPNRVHAFMAYWLSTGGTVITTNYDRLIEQQWGKTDSQIQSRYNATAPNSFTEWEQELKQGGTLFKIHGSLDAPDSCLGALEHVGTQLGGNRADLLTRIVQTRPLCFVGWRGVDPDIPPLLHKTFADRDSSLPIFWIHYEGSPPNMMSLEKAIDDCSPLIKPFADQLPILTEADRIFGEFLEQIGISMLPNPPRKVNSFDFTKAIAMCAETGLLRMVGIALRRSGRYYDRAEQVLNAALKIAKTSDDRSAALQEIALLKQQLTGRETSQARRSLGVARASLDAASNPRAQLNINFGLLSMSIVNIKSQPWLLLKIPGLFRKYRQSIEALRRQDIDKESVALHESLLHLYRGRLRFKLLEWLGVFVPPLVNWILEPFEIARTHIDQAKDVSLHSRIDVLAYRAVAFAHLRRCKEVKDDVEEVSRLIMIFNDDARTRHWKTQHEDIQRHCS